MHSIRKGHCFALVQRLLLTRKVTIQLVMEDVDSGGQTAAAE